jgi:hypothetical protein
VNGVPQKKLAGRYSGGGSDGGAGSFQFMGNKSSMFSPFFLAGNFFNTSLRYLNELTSLSLQVNKIV